MNFSYSTLIIIGMPLDENKAISNEILKKFEDADLLIGESKKITYRRLKNLKKEIFCLDNISKTQKENLFEKLKSISKEGKTVCLFADIGMPGLFDPGGEIIEWCKNMNYKIHTIEGPTSWGTACALSCFKGPFLILGFPPQKSHERKHYLLNYKPYKENIVIMDTPYRFRNLLNSAIEVFGHNQEAFLAWEIGKNDEELLWGKLSELLKISDEKRLLQGEFVLVLKSRHHE